MTKIASSGRDILSFYVVVSIFLTFSFVCIESPYPFLISFVLCLKIRCIVSPLLLSHLSCFVLEEFASKNFPKVCLLSSSFFGTFRSQCEKKEEKILHTSTVEKELNFARPNFIVFLFKNRRKRTHKIVSVEWFSTNNNGGKGKSEKKRNHQISDYSKTQ